MVVSANLYYNSRTSVLGRLRDYLRLLMKRSVYDRTYICLVSLTVQTSVNLTAVTVKKKERGIAIYKEKGPTYNLLRDPKITAHS